jgi:hypothetical protein
MCQPLEAFKDVAIALILTSLSVKFSVILAYVLLSYMKTTAAVASQFIDLKVGSQW